MQDIGFQQKTLEDSNGVHRQLMPCDFWHFFTPERPEITSTRILLVIHHLVVDLVSWQVLLEDLESLGSNDSL